MDKCFICGGELKEIDDVLHSYKLNLSFHKECLRAIYEIREDFADALREEFPELFDVETGAFTGLSSVMSLFLYIMDNLMDEHGAFQELSMDGEPLDLNTKQGLVVAAYGMGRLEEAKLRQGE